MDLFSCGNCGVVLDKYRIPEPGITNEDDCSIDTTKAVWRDGDYKATIECPCCKERILFENGDIA